jgi:hypothetical protein
MATKAYLNPARVKPFLIHKDRLVRRSVAAYFRESLSQDEELIPSVVQACEQYGANDDLTFLEAARYFRQSYSSATSILRLLERAEDETLQSALNNILSTMSAPVFFLCQGKLMYGTRVFPSTRDRLHQRLGIWNRSPERLVANFERLIEETPDDDELSSKNRRRTLTDDLVDALVPYDEPRSRYLIQRLECCSGKRDWGVLPVIDLLGKRRIRSAVPTIIECFRIDSEHVARHAAEALIRIGDEGAVQHLRERMPYEGACFRARAIRTLIGFKHLESEWLLLDLLEGEADPELRARLCEGLCCHYALRGQTLIRRQIEYAAPEDARRLKVGLLVTSIIQGRHLPEAPAWREEIQDYRESEKTVGRAGDGRSLEKALH